MVIVAKNFKKAESILKDSEEKMAAVFTGKKGEISFARQEA
jgi:translation initiation factor 2 alpha subunit (eIF-2alpha)